MSLGSVEQALLKLLLRVSEPQFLHLCMRVAQSCPTLCDVMDCSPPGSSVRGILQARVLESVAISFSRGSSQLRNQTWVSCTAGRFTVKPWGKPLLQSIKWDNYNLPPELVVRMKWEMCVGARHMLCVFAHTALPDPHYCPRGRDNHTPILKVRTLSAQICVRVEIWTQTTWFQSLSPILYTLIHH